MKCLIAFSLCGCAALSGNLPLERPTSGVEVYHSHFGGTANVSLRTMYVANGTPYVVKADVTCGLFQFDAYPVYPGRRQGFSEWGGECSATVRTNVDLLAEAK